VESCESIISKEDIMRWKITAYVVSLILLLMVPGISFSEDQVAEKPTYSEGDYWTLVNRNKSKEVKHSFLREEEDKIVCGLDESDRTRDIYFKARIKSPPLGYPDPIIDFPLTVGKKWEYEFKSTSGEQYKRRSKYTVEAYEPVTVPAGTFQAFKITMITETIGSFKASEKDQYWYCPEVKYIVKRIDKGGNTWELKDYHIK
jgi:hypothetical protein